MSTIKVNKILSANNPVVDVADGLTVTGEVKVGSAVTSNSTGIDITGIATATNVSVGSSVTASTFHGSGANLTSIPAAQLTGTVADARISSSSVTQHVSAFDDTNQSQPLVTDDFLTRVLSCVSPTPHTSQELPGSSLKTPIQSIQKYASSVPLARQ